MLGLGDGGSIDHVHLSFLISRTLDEISLDSIYTVMNLPMKKDVLHNMVGITS